MRETVRKEPILSIRARGQDALARGDYAAALRAFRVVADKYPQSARAQHDIGRVLMAMGDPLGAGEVYMVAHRRQPWVEQYTDSLAEALFQADRKDTLFEMLRSEAAQNGIARDYRRLGTYALRDGAMEEAIDALEQAARLSDKDDPSAYLELAGVYQTLGRREDEVRELRHVMNIDPGQPEARARLRELDEIPGPSFAIEPGED